MELTLKSYKTELAKAILKAAGTVKVREFDEIEPGTFQSYVDDKNDSFDVLVRVDKGGKIIQQSCDCESTEPLCRHTVALIIYIAAGKNKPAGKKRADKPEDELTRIINETDVVRLRRWVLDVLSKNKDLALSFQHHFSPRESLASPERVKALTLDAVKAVIKTRKTAELTEIKRIVELWTEIHRPYIDRFYEAPAEQGAFQQINAVAEVIEDLLQRISGNCKRFIKYLENVLAKSIDSFVALDNDEAWDLATGYFVHGGALQPTLISTIYLNFLYNLWGKEIPARKEKLLHKLITHYVSLSKTTGRARDIHTIVLFNLAATSEQVADYIQLLKPITFKNDYNAKLIALLIKHGYLKLAETYCQEQIRSNFREEYDVVYLKFLRDIYTNQNDLPKLTAILQLLFPLAFDFEDYLFITSQMSDEAELKKWRTKMLARAVSNSRQRGGTVASQFVFRLMDHEQKYKKLIEYINEYTPTALIAQYADKMLLSDHKGFLEKMFMSRDNYFYAVPAEEENAHYASILDVLKQHMSASELKMYIKVAAGSSAFGRLNRFVRYVHEHFKPE